MTNLLNKYRAHIGPLTDLKPIPMFLREQDQPITSKQLIKRFIFEDFDDEKQKHKWYDDGDDEATKMEKIEFQYRRFYRILTKLKISYSRIIPAGGAIHFRSFGDDEADRQIFNCFMEAAQEKGLLVAAAYTLEVADTIRMGGQRVEDLVKHAIEILSLYEPEVKWAKEILELYKPEVLK